MRLSTEDLQRLADVYQTTVRGLMASPESAEQVKLLEEFQDIVEESDPAALRRWLDLGRDIKKR